MWKRVYSKTFKTQDDYFNTLIKNHNSKANENTIVLFLGDMGQKEFFWVIEKMRGKKILIKGNHDTYSNKIYQEVFDVVLNIPIFLHGRIVASHIPIPVEDGVYNIHGHTHAIKLSKPNYINVCPEHTNYEPVLLKKYIKELGKLKKPNYKFLEEWYADIQTSPKRDDLVLNENGLILVEETKKLKESKSE